MMIFRTALLAISFALAVLFLQAATVHAKDFEIPLNPQAGSVKSPTGSLVKPKGKGPFPAIVLQHGCNGPREGYRWVANKLAGWGYAVLLLDSFTTRGVGKGVCDLPYEKWIPEERRAEDAYAALKYLRSLDFVIKDRIGLLGYSNGGGAALSASEAFAPNPKRKQEEIKFAGGTFTAALAIYPECGSVYGNWRVVRGVGFIGPVVAYGGKFRPLQPLLIITGELDDWTPAVHCTKMAEIAADPNFTVIVYTGAHHAFDTMEKVRYWPNARNVNSPTLRGVHVGGNSKARKKLYIDMKSFFDLHLKPRK